MSAFFKSILFFPMMFLRRILQWVLRLVAGFFLLGGIFYLVLMYCFEHGDGKIWFLPWLMFGCGFAAFTVSWFYDAILLKLNPDPNTVLYLKR